MRRTEKLSKRIALIYVALFLFLGSPLAAQELPQDHAEEQQQEPVQTTPVETPEPKKKIEENQSGLLDRLTNSKKAVAPVKTILEPTIKDAGKKTGTPVVIAGEEVFRIRAKLGPYTPDIRAHSISQRLKRLEKMDDREARIDSIAVQEGEYSTDITAGDLTLMTLTTLDAKFEGAEDRKELAEKYAERLKKALKREMEAQNPQVLLRACGLTVAVTIAFVLFNLALTWVFPRIYRLLHRWEGVFIRPLKIQQAQLLSAETITDILVGFFRTLRVLLFISGLGIYLSAALSYFPQTRPLVRDGLHQLAKPVTEVIIPSILKYLPNLVFILLIGIAAYYTIVFTHFIFKEIERQTIVLPGFDPEWSDPTYKIARFLIIAFALILLFPYLPGSGSPAFQQVSIFLGLLFSLASTGPLSHIIAGTFLTYTGALKLGDRVKIADTVGDVVEKTLIATKIQTIKNEIITIPNGLVLGNHIVNYSSSSAGDGLILNTTVTIGYDVPWKEVEKALVEAAKDTDLILAEPEPFVWQTSLGDFSVSYQLNAFTKDPNRMGSIYSNLHKKIQDKCNEAGIEILSPTYSALRDGNHSTIPESYLPSGYQTPSFSVPWVEPGKS